MKYLTSCLWKFNSLRLSKDDDVGKVENVTIKYAILVVFWQTSSLSGQHDELDFEFLGNEPGKTYVLQTNVYTAGVGDREQRIRLWFDPTEDFHTYTIHWNKEIVMYVNFSPLHVSHPYEELCRHQSVVQKV